MGKIITMDKKTTIETLLRQGQGGRAICRMVRSAAKVVIRLRKAMDRETPGLEVPTVSDVQSETVGSKGSGSQSQMVPAASGPRWPRAQMDFVEGPKIRKGEGRGASDTRRSWIMVLTLSHSGKSYREVIANQSAHTVLEALMRGFEEFGGVPEWLKIDNFKAAVTKTHRFDPILR